jgi:branched-chain amino acid transport system ATP-binding protein
MTDPPLLSVAGLSKRFGGVVATDALDLAVHDGEAHAVIGPNGAGKTTLIAQLAGEVRPSAGRIRFAGRDITSLPAHARVGIGLARSFQITSLLASFSALENVQIALRPRLGHSFHPFRDAARDPALNRRAAALLAEVGLAACTPIWRSSRWSITCSICRFAARPSEPCSMPCRSSTRGNGW